MNIGLVPLRNFGILEEGRLYRSAQPIYKYEYGWISNTLGITHLVNLRKESRNDDRYGPAFKIEVLDINIPDHYEPTIEQAEQFLNLLEANPKAVILFHCQHGRGRTSTFAVLARLRMGWTLEQAMKEESDVFNYSFQHERQRKWLEEVAEKIVASIRS